MKLKFWKLRLRKNQILCLLGGAALCGLYLLSHGGGDPGLLARESYGGGEREYRLSVTGLLGEDQETELRVKVAPREYTEAEAEEVFWALMEEIPGRILVSKDALLVETGAGFLSITELQLEGKKRMETADFLRGSGSLIREQGQLTAE